MVVLCTNLAPPARLGGPFHQTVRQAVVYNIVIRRDFSHCREIMETNEKLRDVILGRLLDSFSQIRSSRVCSCSLWIIGEYCRGRAEITSALEVNTQH